MHRVYIKEKLSVGAELLLSPEQSKHLQLVLKAQEGFPLKVLDQTEKVFLAEVKSLGKQVGIRLLREQEEKREHEVEIVLFQSLIKGEKWDFLLQKATELGVTSVVPVLSDTCVVKWTEKDVEKKRERFEKILLSASMQSQRLKIPSLQKLHCFEEMLAQKDKFDFFFACYEKEKVLSLFAYLEEKGLKEQVKQKEKVRIAFFVGAEGGISAKERELLLKEEVEAVHLGHRILRAETAPLYVLSALSFLLEK